MKLFARLWTGVLEISNVFTLSPVDVAEAPQELLNIAHSSHPLPLVNSQKFRTEAAPPIFEPPAGSSNVPITCDYSAMNVGANPMTGWWKDCSSEPSRSCWLRNNVTKEEYNITTNYEKKWPKGVTRRYYLNVTEQPLYPDGVQMQYGKVFNGQFPGPWIQGCWGDTLEILVENHLVYNGTTIHWHGVRQLNSMEMDGVNGITQCPIAPGKSFTYKFDATQYGSSWYHSHYSLQYADGLLGALTFYGPASSPYTDVVNPPLMMQDWSHRSAFQDFYWELAVKPFDRAPQPFGPPPMTSMLMNGTGYYGCSAEQAIAGKCASGTPSLYQLIFQKGKKYLLRLINTSVDTTFVFSIDNHNVTIIAADYVPITPYTNNSVLIGIGQRYTVVVEANPSGPPVPDDNYWIRMTPADGCNSFPTPPDPRRGVLRYNAQSTAVPTSQQGSFSLKCSDETYSSLKPVVPWTVGAPVNPQELGTLEAGLAIPNTSETGRNQGFQRWALGNVPMWLEFGNPSIMNLNLDPGKWDPSTVVIPAAYDENSWMYVIITAAPMPFKQRLRTMVPVAHPIHLHGHDFAILEQADHPYWERMVNLKWDNPPRRDVALLPHNGYLVIAFRTDNPGTWIMHCHIAMHASSGLAVQFLERVSDLQQRYTPQKLAPFQEMCNDWNSWHNDPDNWYDDKAFQDDSGI